ncbi:helix-turn-helix domain-containing protein [Psychroserpens algicola]|uniref:helix-turn-helix domain-containing protein n=1 Tax=Psychroserpens algicola TaxID=1719034 RepID=UPI001952CBD6|nr:helix-turn-helix domain-containing protein [Psychroserpens algicola]
MRKVEIEQVSIRELIEKFEEIIIKNTNFQKPEFESNIPDILTRNQVAEMLQVSKVTLNNWAKNKVLIPYSIGTRVYYRKEDIFNSMKGGKNV